MTLTEFEKRLDRLRAAAETGDMGEDLVDSVKTLTKERDEAREALEAMVLNCRYGCNRDSNCGMCAIAMKVLPNGWPVQLEDK